MVGKEQTERDFIRSVGSCFISSFVGCLLNSVLREGGKEGAGVILSFYTPNLISLQCFFFSSKTTGKKTLCYPYFFKNIYAISLKIYSTIYGGT